MGDEHRLIGLEAHYAPSVMKGRGVFSDLDKNHHAPWNLGGDKMASDRNDYAPIYGAVLPPFYASANLVVELGVFTGVSMAIWCDVFEQAEIVGLDLDFSRFEENLPSLTRRGAFSRVFPRLVEWDAYGDVAALTEALSAPVDVFVDDGPHTADAVFKVARDMAPLMSDRMLYAIEDFTGGHAVLSEVFPEAEIVKGGRLNVAVRR